MPEKNVSVKCEVNEKNKDIIKHALCDALKIEYSSYDSFRGNGSGAQFTFFLSEAPDSSGFYLRIIYEQEELSGASCILPCIVGVILLILWFWKIHGPWWGLLICEIIALSIVVGIQSEICYNEAAISKKIDSVINALNLKTVVEVQGTINTGKG